MKGTVRNSPPCILMMDPLLLPRLLFSLLLHIMGSEHEYTHAHSHMYVPGLSLPMNKFHLKHVLWFPVTEHRNQLALVTLFVEQSTRPWSSVHREPHIFSVSVRR